MVRYTILMCSLFVIGVMMVAFFINKGINSYKEEYVKPDTTIVYKNSKWDTTITIKPLPSWLK